MRYRLYICTTEHIIATDGHLYNKYTVADGRAVMQEAGIDLQGIEAVISGEYAVAVDIIMGSVAVWPVSEVR